MTDNKVEIDHINAPNTAGWEQVLHAPKKVVWNTLVNNFGTWADWCPNLFEDMRIINGKHGIGGIRKFKTGNNLLYEEILVEADEEAGYFRYDFVTITPKQQGLNGVVNKVYLVPDGPMKTKITWKSWTATDANLPNQARQTIYQMQTIGFKKETEALDAHLIIGAMVGQGLEFFNSKIMSLSRALLTKQGDMWAYEEYPDKFGYLPKMVKGLPPSEALPPHKIGDMLTRFLEVLYLQAGQIIDDQNNPLRKPNPDMPYEEEARGMIKIGHIKPKGLEGLTEHVIANWEDDAEFCRQLLQGVNPLQISMVKSISEIPDILRGLQATEANGDKTSVEKLIQAKRLFILDYSELATYDANPNSYFAAPIMLVYREILDKDTSRLNILGIQLHPAHKEVYTPDMPQKNRYKLAKMFVASADNQFHEFRHHLCIAHMGMEPIAIAVHNRLPDTHPVRILLKPHLEGTIGIGYFARQTLIDDRDPFTDKTFAVGTKGGLRLASEGWRKYHFFNSSFPKQLLARGFDEKGTDGVQDYFYRDDGFKLWNAIGKYTTDFVDRFYKNDTAVHADSDLQRWADEMSAKDAAAIPGFPSVIENKERLCQILQIIIWNGSAQHSAVNYPQWPYLGYSPNRPNALYQPMPEPAEDGSDISDDYIKKSLAPTFQMLFQVTFSWLLSLPSDSNLLNLRALQNIYPEGDQKFQESLAKLTMEIKARNQALEAAGKAPYIFLLPENVACSVNI